MSKEEREDFRMFAKSVDSVEVLNNELMIDLGGVDLQELFSVVLERVPEEDLLERLGKEKCEGYWRGREER